MVPAEHSACKTRVKYLLGTCVCSASESAESGRSNEDAMQVIARSAYSAVFEIMMTIRPLVLTGREDQYKQAVYYILIRIG